MGRTWQLIAPLAQLQLLEGVVNCAKELGM